MRTSTEMIAALNAVEERFPVQRWRMGDIDLWPSYRVRLYGIAIDAALLSQAPAASRLGRVGRLASRGLQAIVRVPLARLRDLSANAHPRPGTPAVFLSDGVSFAALDGRWYDRVMDPAVEACRAHSIRSLKLTPMAQAHVPRAEPSMLIQPTIDRIKLLASAAMPLRLELPEFDRTAAFARDAFGLAVPGQEWLAKCAGRLDALAGWFGRLLHRTGAQHAFVNTYYSLEGMAFIQAARRQGVHSVDIQHGMQGPQHVAYARWLGVPPTGYSTLPDEFWVWSATEADAIAEWAGAIKRHRPVVSGNPWLDLWRDETHPLVARYMAQARAMRSGEGPHALVSLSWGIDREETDKIIRAAKRCPNVTWWWRLHPVEAQRRDLFARQLEAEGIDGSRVGPATDLPLYAVIRAADMTIAHSSTTIQEAAEFSVPSIVTSDYGASLHAGLVRQGIALHATSDEAIAAAVRALAARPRHATSGGERSSRLDELIAGFADHNRKRQPEPENAGI